MTTVGAWTYDPPDPSVGIFGGAWFHNDCPLDDPDSYPEEDTNGRVTCPCGAVLDPPDLTA